MKQSKRRAGLIILVIFGGVLLGLVNAAFVALPLHRTTTTSIEFNSANINRTSAFKPVKGWWVEVGKDGQAVVRGQGAESVVEVSLPQAGAYRLRVALTHLPNDLSNRPIQAYLNETYLGDLNPPPQAEAQHFELTVPANVTHEGVNNRLRFVYPAAGREEPNNFIFHSIVLHRIATSWDLLLIIGKTSVHLIWQVGLLLAGLVILFPVKLKFPKLEKIFKQGVRSINGRNLRFQLPGPGMLAGVLLGSVALLAIGLSRTLPIFLANMVAGQGMFYRVVDLKDYEKTPEGDYYSFDISRLGLRSIADRVNNPSWSPLILLENGVPLSPYASFDDLKADKAGVFSHWWYLPANPETVLDPRNDQDRIFFSPLHNDPAENIYTLRVPATSADALPISRSTLLQNIHSATWKFALIAGLIAAWLCHRSIQGASRLWYQLPLTLVLIVSFYLITAFGIMEVQPCRPAGAFSVWKVFCVSPDSSSYYFDYTAGSTRQPGYPWFIRLVTDHYDPNIILDKTPVGAWIEETSHPLLKVSRTQMTLLLGTGIILGFTLMALLRSPLPALFLVFFYDFHLFIWFNLILTEPLVQSWLLLIVTCFLIFLWTEKPFLLPVIGILIVGSYLTRQASAYTFLFLVAMIIWALVKNWRRYWKSVVISLALFVILAAIPDIYAFLTIGKSSQENLSWQYRIVFALRVAQPADIEAMPDEESRLWLVESLPVRDQKDREFDEQCGLDLYCRYIYRIESTYEVAVTQSIRPLHQPSFYLRVSNEIFKRRWLDYLRFGGEFWLIAFTAPQVDRIGSLGRVLTNPVNPWYVYLVAFVLIGLIRGRVGYSSATLILAHWAHVMLNCFFAVPGARMVWASDGLVFIALFILVMEIIRLGFERGALFTTAPQHKEASIQS